MIIFSHRCETEQLSKEWTGASSPHNTSVIQTQKSELLFQVRVPSQSHNSKCSLQFFFLVGREVIAELGSLTKSQNVPSYLLWVSWVNGSAMLTKDTKELKSKLFSALKLHIILANISQAQASTTTRSKGSFLCIFVLNLFHTCMFATLVLGHLSCKVSVHECVHQRA